MKACENCSRAPVSVYHASGRCPRALDLSFLVPGPSPDYLALLDSLHRMMLSRSAGVTPSAGMGNG